MSIQLRLRIELKEFSYKLSANLALFVLGTIESSVSSAGFWSGISHFWNIRVIRR